ncbi:MAG TPA: glucoamylase family protein [Caldilineaceae bacterium]|nr:glucoamylase family protein [Caldilineaceae bacterium]
MNNRKQSHADPKWANNEELLDNLQRVTFDYFWHEVNPQNGLVADSTRTGSPASTATVGFALTIYPIAVERGFVPRDEAVARTLTTLRFLLESPQGTEASASGYMGFFYHFLDMDGGHRFETCELSTIDTTFLLAGALTAAQYFQRADPAEQEIRQLADDLYRRVDWQWAQNGGRTVAMGWTPEDGFLPYRWQGYSEALLLYLLALASPTTPLQPDSYEAWTATYHWDTFYGYDLLYAGPLFIHQFSHMWVDFRQIQDAYMRRQGIDYFENSRRATYLQQQYAIDNPHQFARYGEFCWGITACDGPEDDCEVDGELRHFFGYLARGAPLGPDDGTLAPWAAVASLPFAPEIVLPTLRYLAELHLQTATPYGFKCSFNPTYPVHTEDGKREALGWVSPWHLGINQGPIVIMTENYRSGLVWQLMRSCPYLALGLQRAGFEGGWLTAVD